MNYKESTAQKILFVGIILFFGLAGTSNGQIQQRTLAILETQEDEGSNISPREYAAYYMTQVAGIPFTKTDSLEEAVQHKFILTTARISTRPNYHSNSFTEEELQQLTKYVEEGGIIIAPNLRDPAVFPLFGITGESFSNDRFSMSFSLPDSSNINTWIDDPKETTISIGDSTYGGEGRAANSRSYTLGEANVMARFDDNSAAITVNQYGKGYAYAIGLSFQDAVIRNMINRDFSAERTYSNGFEPSGDVFPLMIRGIYMDHVDQPVWKHTSPFASATSLLITHDVDAGSAMEIMNQFAAYEQNENIQASYYITTHYINDKRAGDYYTPYRDSITRLHEQNQIIGSHSVGHFPDFDELPWGELGETMATYTPQYNGDSTEGGTILGELEVSQQLLEEDVPQQIRSFRSGHLLFPNQLPNALDTLDYIFDSSNSMNAVLTGFPYRLYNDRSFSGSLSDVLEIPMTISDVFGNEPISEDNYQKKVEGWLTVLNKYKNNGSPVNLLIHPNRIFKLEAEKSFVSQLPDDVLVLPLKKYGRYWIQRNKTRFRTWLDGSQLNIQLKHSRFPSDSVSFMTAVEVEVDDIRVTNNKGEKIDVTTTQTGKNRLVIHPSKATDISRRPSTQPEEIVLKPNRPNPFNPTTKIEYRLPRIFDVELTVFDVLGRRVVTLVDETQQAGQHSVTFNAGQLSSGVYIYRIKAGKYTESKTMMLVK